MLSALYVSGNPLEIIEESPSHMVLSWHLNDYQLRSLQSQGQSHTRIFFNSQNMASGDSGKALLPGYSFYIGVPSSGGVAVTMTPESVHTELLQFPPVPSMQKEVAGSDPRFLSSWISEPQYTRFREYRAARIVISPFLYDQHSGELRVLRRGTVTVRFADAVHRETGLPVESDYEKMVRSMLLNYTTARGWVKRRDYLGRTAVEQFPISTAHQVYKFRIGDGNRGFNEATTMENGILRISGQRLRALFGSSVRMSDVALYASYKGELDKEVPPEGQIPASVFEIPLLRVEANPGGVVHNEDYALAYVTGASDWVYDPQAEAFSMRINRYDDYRTYWLVRKSGGGLAMEQFLQPQNPTDTNSFFQNNYYLRRPRELLARYKEGSVDWVYKRFDNSSQARRRLVEEITLPLLDSSLPGEVVFRKNRHSVGNGRISASMGESICERCDTLWHAIDRWGSGTLDLEFASNSGFFELDGVHFRYHSQLAIRENSSRLAVFSDVSQGISGYSLSGTGDKPVLLFRIPADESAITLIDSVRFDQTEHYFWSDTGGSGVRYFISSEDDFFDLPDVDAVTFSNSGLLYRNIRDNSNSTDYLIVTHAEFMDAALRLASHKNRHRFSNARVVLIDDVYNQFSGGNTDPVAVRNFLLYVYRHWDGGSDLSYVVLFGSGHYDYKNISTTEENLLPTAQIDGRNMDLYFTFFDTEESYMDQLEPFYFTGRLPAKTRSEAEAIVDKIVEVEEMGTADFGSWRNRVLLVADDDMQGDKKDPINLHFTPHHESSESVAEIIQDQRPYTDIRKLYLFEYEWDELYRKPAASRALINEINSGVSAVNFFGHGSYHVWADEYILTRESAQNLHNRGRYPLVSSFSCAVARFDTPNEDCLSSILTKQAASGAIATISATRDVQATPNEGLALNVFRYLFSQDSNLSIGASFVRALSDFRHPNNLSYVILGDPSIRLVSRSRNVALSVYDSEGNSSDTLKALQQITVRGEVTFENGQLDRSFGDGGNGFVQIGLFNPQDTTTRKDGGTATDPVYALPGSPVFSGKIPVSGGVFEQTILLPQNLTFDREGIRFNAYAWQDSIVGAGFRGDLIFSGTDDREITDTAGPVISIRPIYDSEQMDQSVVFVSNRLSAQLPLKCEISIVDESGIDMVGVGPDEGITLEVKGALSRRNINHLFQFEEGDFRRGVAVFNFDEGILRTGKHIMEITARDLVGNLTKQTIELEIVEERDLRLDHVLNIPNPMRMGLGTRFFFHHSNTTEHYSDVELTIRIYSLNGRLLRVIRNARNGEFWDGRDQAGNLLTPNVYLYQVSAPNSGRTLGSQGTTVRSKIKKLVVHPPR